MQDFHAARIRLESAITADNLRLASLRLWLALKRNPNWYLQPRAPSGTPEGGQWVQSAPLTESDDSPVLLAQAESPAFRPVNLMEEEAAGGHTLQMHVGRSPESLRARVAAGIRRSLFYSRILYRDGSFPSLAAATKLVNATLARNRAVMEKVAAGKMQDAFVTASFSSQTGIEAFKPSPYAQPYLRPTYGVGVYIIHDRRRPNGFRVQTAYPREE